jgi:beta-glucanase (GH16 family)
MRNDFIVRAAAALILFAGLTGCEKNAEGSFTVDFSYEIGEDNLVSFTNESTGDFYWMTWDFGNGETLTTTDRNETIEMYYPESGEYTVSLKLSNTEGISDTQTIDITISEDDLVPGFTAETDPSDPNIIKLTNTTQGNYETISWNFRERKVTDQEQFNAYFPYSGTQVVRLEIEKFGYTFSLEKNVSISQDDPGYIDKLELAWEDNFDGPDLNTGNWRYDVGASGWGNNELQNYTSGDNVEIVDGILVITAEKEDNFQVPGSYTSTRITTYGKQEFTYGRMEIRAKLPSGRGIWPAIWMLGSSFETKIWPACGEIDIMEYVGYEPDVIHSTVHTPSGYRDEGNGSSRTLETAEEAFHVYGALWTEREIRFYVDSPSNITHIYKPTVRNADTWPFNEPQFFILNVAVGGTWGGAQGIDDTIFPQAMEIDYVRVYQEPFPDM